MPDFRRYFIPGATYFFTAVTDGREPFLCTPMARGLLRRKLVECQTRWPFTIDAIVLLPDHLHTIWTLPPEDDRYSVRWAWLKKEFTKDWLATGHTERPVSDGRKKDGRRGVWQPKFWEHTIQDETDFAVHLDYVHYNPVKHGSVSSPRGWEWSSLHRWVRAGVYDQDWGAGEGDRLAKLNVDFGE
jgi:putative transposase